MQPRIRALIGAAFIAAITPCVTGCSAAIPKKAVSSKRIEMQRTECGAGTSVTVEGSRVWGPTLEVTKFEDGEYRGYTLHGAPGMVQIHAGEGEIRGAYNGAPVHLRVRETDDGYFMRGLFGGQFVYFNVVEPARLASNQEEPDGEVWTAAFRSRIRGPRCLGGTITFPTALARLPLEDRAAIMAMFVL